MMSHAYCILMAVLPVLDGPVVFHSHAYDNSGVGASVFGLSGQTSHTCHRNEGCLELRAMCRPGENCQRQRRPPHRICVPVGTNVNGE